MKRLTLTIMIIVNILILTACSSAVTKKPLDSDSPPMSQQTNKVLLASGYSKRLHDPQLTQLQNQYGTEQAAKLDAYRDLAKQLYSEKLSNGVVVANQVIKDEVYRIYLDLFLREAKVVDSKLIAGQQQIALELNVTPRFYQCFSGAVDIVSQCLQETNKTPFTRMGYQQIPLTIVNLSCTSANCGEQLHVSGFSKEKTGMDKSLLNYGFYDTEWSINTTLRTALRYVFLSQVIF